MPKVQPPPYPSALTVAAWNKAKGILARIKQIETGITKELQAAAKQFNDAPWKALDVTVIVAEENKRKMPAGLTVQDLETIQRDYLQTYQPTFKQLQGRFAELHTFLKDKAVSLAQDDATKGFAKAVELMAEEANKFTYAVAWGTVSSDNQKWLTLMLENKKKEVAIRAKAKEDLVSMIDKAITEVKMSNKKPNWENIKHFGKITFAESPRRSNSPGKMIRNI